jgi:hypothetical protein
VERLALRFGPQGAFAVLREPCGHDEEAIEAATTAQAIALLDRLLVAAAPGQGTAPRAGELCAADRDLLLGALYRTLYGDEVESTVRCRGCDQPFDLEFSLTALTEDLRPASAAPARREDGTYLLPDRRRCRLPPGDDELAVADLPAERAPLELQRRCMVAGGEGKEAGSAADDPAPVVEAMRAAAPIVDLEVDATCPECRLTQPVHFDLQRYLLSRLLGERRQRTHEIHRIARAYGWPRREILDLPRSTRQLHVELIDRDGGARWRTT